MAETRNIFIIAATILLAVIIFCFGTRYQIGGVPGGHVIMYDRITGNSWVYNYASDKYYPVEKGK